MPLLQYKQQIAYATVQKNKNICYTVDLQVVKQVEQRDKHKLKNRYYTLRSVPNGTFESLFDVKSFIWFGS